MSYDPDRQQLTELLSAWSSTDQTLPTKTSGGEFNYNTTFNLKTVGEGDITISSNVINLGEDGLYAFFIGDLRSTSPTPPPSVSGDIYEMHFNTSDGAYSAALQRQRTNSNDDQCYSLDSTAELKLGYALRIGGNTIAPWLRVLGVLVEG
jgi:hypothetical protein